MAFKLKWACEYCGYELIATTDETNDMLCPDCETYEPAEPKPVEMSKAERSERYKIQYKANGYSWLDKQPWMWEGKL